MFTVRSGRSGERRDLDWQLREGSAGVWLASSPAGVWLRVRFSVLAKAAPELVEHWAEFIVSPDGRHVSCQLSHPQWASDAAELFIGPLFSAVLSRHHRLSLHANVVEFDGRCAGIIGPAGSGKSTMSLALVNRGAHLVSDDLAALCETPGALSVWPGLPRVRIHESAAAIAAAGFDTLQPLWSVKFPFEDKRYLDLSGNTPDWGDRPLPLHALYLLADAEVDQPYVRRLHPAQALGHLMSNRHMPRLLDPDSDARDFFVIARLVGEIPVAVLYRPRRLSSLDTAAAAVLADVSSSA
ncbi:MAG TPA: hypothetical protein VME46_12530 [Acidimicrobiales bacterium]|nr:hypothetical protein [Acidimicrobiales bacterium]